MPPPFNLVTSTQPSPKPGRDRVPGIVLQMPTRPGIGNKGCRGNVLLGHNGAPGPRTQGVPGGEVLSALSGLTPSGPLSLPTFSLLPPGPQTLHYYRLPDGERQEGVPRPHNSLPKHPDSQRTRVI
ncbi:hypothetical protein DPEC_G00184250 [Dallia pectoralis]|uniref:Uncharacterized protein n=1 Tax=Dallia pectoralis TaxID=75939 RepID=A0ACC2GB18_DALPE|nr:hypothetical protein DPEC_G00184250 [Dallia pectoralis]